MRFVFINLDHRVDRRVEFENECANLEIPAERFSAIYRNPGGIGCCISHLEVLRDARARGDPEICIFEDDFEFLVSRDEFRRVLDSLPEDYDVVMLGYCIVQSEEYTPEFGRTIEAQTTSGYIVRQKAYDQLISVWEAGLSEYEKNPSIHWLYILDQTWKPLQKTMRWYHAIPRVGKQRAGWSDLSEEFINRGV